MTFVTWVLRTRPAWRSGIVAVASVLAVASVPGAAHPAQKVPDPAKTVGPAACGECHEDSVRIWKDTHHAKSFRTMPRSDKAREIADKLDIKRIKRESICLNCHFTSTIAGGKERPISGTSCESCHGAGKDWIKVHSDYGGKLVSRATEAAAHRTQRIAASDQAGMIRPARLFTWASNCYQCHTVPEERLVNVGGHPAGSRFELVAWSQGEIRHNVWFSGGKENMLAAPEQRRVMYVVGRALDLVYALRGVAKATTKDKYAVRMAKRARAARGHLNKIAELMSVPEVETMLAVAKSAKLKLNNGAALTKAAEAIAAEAKKVAQTYDGSTLAALDPLLPSPDTYKGTPAK